ncbi:hypothetical protein ALC56_04133, partial [Trachymyrmex septentrionalis]
KIHVSEYSYLKILVLKYFSAPSSSMYSERFVSTEKLIYTDNRNRLSPKNAEMLLFIMTNLLISNFDY